jgi:protein-tyrosine phosphatase
VRVPFNDGPMQSPRKKWRILFVCMGNICRSPSAEIIFRKMVAKARREDEFEIDSAGTIGDHQGNPPDSRMAAALVRKGYEISGTSRKITTSDLDYFDRVIVMDETNLRDVRRLDPGGEFCQKIIPLVRFCRNSTDLRVPDPYYGGEQGFQHVVELLEDGCQGILLNLQ